MNLKMENLSPREQMLWKRIAPQSGVLMAYGIPGISKSATFRSIAAKLGLQYVDLRLSTMDETDLGGFPHKDIVEGCPVVQQCVPVWAMAANRVPTLIHFEELNRCAQNIRNAALGILLERRIGPSFCLGRNVFMVASGNPLNDHDADIFPLGSALVNRLVIHRFSLSFEDWKNEFALNHGINHLVLEFLEQHPAFFGIDETEIAALTAPDGDVPQQYPSPRSWTFLSDYLQSLSEDDRGKEMLNARSMAEYVGEAAAARFVIEVRGMVGVRLKQVLDGTVEPSAIRSEVVPFILEEFWQNHADFTGLSQRGRTNFSRFFRKCLPAEQQAGFIGRLLSSGVVTLQTIASPEANVEFLKEHTGVIDAMFTVRRTRRNGAAEVTRTFERGTIVQERRIMGKRETILRFEVVDASLARGDREYSYRLEQRKDDGRLLSVRKLIFTDSALADLPFAGDSRNAIHSLEKAIYNVEPLMEKLLAA